MVPNSASTQAGMITCWLLKQQGKKFNPIFTPFLRDPQIWTLARGRLLPGGGAIGHKNRQQAGEGKYDGTDDIVLKEKTGSPDEEEERAQKVGQAWRSSLIVRACRRSQKAAFTQSRRSETGFEP